MSLTFYSTFHVFTQPELDQHPAATRLPSGLKATDQTTPRWWRGGSTSCPVVASQTRTILSSPPEAIRLPSGENATLWTRSSCPLNVSNSLPVRASQTLTVWSQLAEAM